MFVPARLLDWLHVAKDTVDSLRQEIVALKVENTRLKEENLRAVIQNDWLRVQVNSLQFERTALLDKAYGIKVPTPEIAKVPSNVPNLDGFSFEDLGDEMARKLGLPDYGLKA